MSDPTQEEIEAQLAEGARFIAAKDAEIERLRTGMAELEKIAAGQKERIAELEEELNSVLQGLLALTPSGSEFFEGYPDNVRPSTTACFEYLKDMRGRFTARFKDVSKQTQRIAELEAEVARLKALVTWSPISDVHKDGLFWQVGWHDEWGFPGTYAQWDNQFNVWRTVGGKHVKPTHAAPIPQPPVKGDEK